MKSSGLIFHTQKFVPARQPPRDLEPSGINEHISAEAVALFCRHHARERRCDLLHISVVEFFDAVGSRHGLAHGLV